MSATSVTSALESRAHSEFQEQLPHELVPTNIDGAFGTPAAPDHVDLNTATATTLARYGIFLRRPTAQDAPNVRAAWDRVFSGKLRAADRIQPHLEPQIGITHRRRGVRRTDTGFSSSNWGGGSVQGNWVTASGSWTVPTVSRPSEAQGTEGGWNSSSWVGIDGAYGSDDVLQAGVQQKVDANGNASYVAWFEWFAPISKVVLGDTSPLTPALASLNGRMYIAWKGDGNDNLNVMVSTDNGNTFHNKFVSGETSPQAPALAAHNGLLFIGWKGDGNDQLNVAVVDLDGAGNPTGFSGKVVLGDTSPLSPSLASVGGNLYLAWRGDGNDNLNVEVSLDNGRTFRGKFVSGETSTQAPALGTFNGNLMIAWKGDGNDNLNIARVNINPAPTGFSNKATLGDTSPHSPALAELNGRLYIAWKGDRQRPTQRYVLDRRRQFWQQVCRVRNQSASSITGHAKQRHFHRLEGRRQRSPERGYDNRLASASLCLPDKHFEFSRKGGRFRQLLRTVRQWRGRSNQLCQHNHRPAHKRNSRAASRRHLRRQQRRVDYGSSRRRRADLISAQIHSSFLHVGVWLRRKRPDDW
jgi:hypothetical protein